MWTAISLWLTTLGLGVVYVAFAVRAVMHGGRLASWIAGAVVLYFASILLLCISYFAISWIWRARRPHDVRIGMRATLRLWWDEYATLAGSPPRLMLYRWLVRDPDPEPVD